MGKSCSGIMKLASKITGCIIWSGNYPQNRKVQCFLNHDQYEQGSSKVVSIIYKLILTMLKDFGTLPPHCHINLDNCWRENKNMYLFSFLSALVQLDVFVDITVDFMLVGHTGNQVDQLFSILASEFKSEIRSPDDLLAKIRTSAIQPQPLCEELYYIWNFRDFIKPKMSDKRLVNHSFLHSFLVKKESGVAVLRGRKYPQDSCDWKPKDGIKLLKDNATFEEVDVAELRVEKLNLDAVFSGLYSKYIPQLPESEQREVTASWERMKSSLENLPKKAKHLPKMKLLDLPKQIKNPSPIPPAYLEPFLHEECRELMGAKHIEDPEESNFRADIKPSMDVAIFTQIKSTRPWLGRVLSVMSSGEEFTIQWFGRKNKSLLFVASEVNGTPFTSTLSTDSVMMWNFTDKKTDKSFELSQEWHDKIMKEYLDHDLCYV